MTATRSATRPVVRPVGAAGVTATRPATRPAVRPAVRPVDFREPFWSPERGTKRRRATETLHQTEEVGR